jgi:putative transposase
MGQERWKENADVNGTENIRQNVSQTLYSKDTSNGWLAQPSVYLFDTENGCFAP